MRRYSKRSASGVEKALLRYQNALAEERLLQSRIDSLEDRTKATTRRITGLPKADAADAVPLLLDERSRLKAMVERSQEIKEEVLCMLSALPDDQKRLLTAYYVEGKSLEAAAEYVPCSKRTAVEMKKRALLNIAKLL